MTDIEWGKIHEHYYKAYDRIFECLDFSKKPDRFTEENQVVNFCEAVKSVYLKDAICWYEYPWSPSKSAHKKKNSGNRFDAVVYIPSIKALLIVEAKCLRKTTKYESITNDLMRVCEQKNEQITLVQDKCIENIYVVILADYWKKTKGPQKDILDQWNSEVCNGLLHDFIEEVKDKVTDSMWTVSPDERFSPYDSYYLLSMIGEIK